MKFNLLSKALGTTALVCAFSAAAHAGDLPSIKAPIADPVIESFQPYFLKLGFTYAINQSTSKMYVNGAQQAFGATIADVPTLGFEAGWYVWKNISINVSGGIPVRADDKIFGGGARNGIVLAHLLPAIIPVTVVYHIDGYGAFQPYIGVGAGPGFSFGNRNAYLTNVRVSGAFNTVVQFGFDYMLTQRFGLSFDAKKAFTYLSGHGVIAPGNPLAGAAVTQSTHFNPWILSTGVVYRFGGSDPVPVVAKY
jgi:outer membrane protein W